MIASEFIIKIDLLKKKDVVVLLHVYFFNINLPYTGNPPGPPKQRFKEEVSLQNLLKNGHTDKERNVVGKTLFLSHA